MLTDAINIDWSHRPLQLPPTQEIKKALDSSFYGLDKVKEHFLEVAAQVSHNSTIPKWGILLSDPAGVGKSMIAQAFSEQMGLPIHRLDMSTTNDIEALTGSSIIYENGRQGAILNTLISSNDCRVLFLMQELDKLHSGSPVHSSPDSALLTLMDGCGFVDNYWDIAIPTDQIFCIATCNDPDLISAPLRDRFIEIKGPAYTRDEKAVIFEQ